jgi:hypothetical protein
MFSFQLKTFKSVEMLQGEFNEEICLKCLENVNFTG